MAAETLKALITKWRADAEQIATFHATMGMGYTQCAKELETALALCESPAAETPRKQDNVLVEIVGDLNWLSQVWKDIDVDDRNALTSKWRRILRESMPDAETRIEAALSVARHAVNGWACYAKRASELDEIARLHREIDKLTPPPAPPAAETWQPIATAPRDGTQIWAWDNERGANPAIWIPFKPVVDGDDGGTWVITYDDADIKPTLWMRLPAPPTSGAAQETKT